MPALYIRNLSKATLNTMRLRAAAHGRGVELDITRDKTPPDIPVYL